MAGNPGRLAGPVQTHTPTPSPGARAVCPSWVHPCPRLPSVLPAAALTPSPFPRPRGGCPHLTQLRAAAAAGAASEAAGCGGDRRAPAPAPWPRRGASGAQPSCTGPAAGWGSEAGVAGGLAGGLEVGAGTLGGRAVPHGTGSQGLWCAEGGGLQERRGAGVRDLPHLRPLARPLRGLPIPAPP